ncbi:MAG: single-stranded DNA-binding protein [Victivallales bacterium]|nr:single-stranded DNA-binding protein [Victivallales bacterium]
MAALNKVLLIGNLTREPELRYTPGGAAVCEFGLAMNRKFSANGQDREETCFVDIVVWGKQAESCNRYLEKGAPAFIEGRLSYEQWQDRDTNAKRSRLRVVAERVQFLGSRGGSDKGGDGGQSYGGNDYQDDQYYDNGSGYDNQPQGGGQPRGGNQSYGRQPAPSRPAPAQNYPQEQYRPQPPQSQPAPARQAPPPPPPPMPQGSFDVEDAEDDIPF